MVWEMSRREFPSDEIVIFLVQPYLGLNITFLQISLRDCLYFHIYVVKSLFISFSTIPFLRKVITAGTMDLYMYAHAVYKIQPTYSGLL